MGGGVRGAAKSDLRQVWIQSQPYALWEIGPPLVIFFSLKAET